MGESQGEGEKTEQQCWKMMTRAEKLLLCLLVMTLIVLVLLGTYVAFIFISAEKRCDTPNCIKASAKLLELVDFSRSPCDDFRKFVCRNYVPSSDSRDDISLKKQTLLAQPPENSDSLSLVSAKRFYRACINSSSIEESEEIRTISSILDLLGGWPILQESKWKGNHFTWQQLMVDARKGGIRNDWFINLDYFTEDGRNQLLISPPNLKPNHNKYRLVYYEEAIMQLAAKLGSYASIQVTKIKQIMDFEDELARISKNARDQIAERRSYTKMKVSELNERWPNIYLVDILNQLARGFSVFTNSTVVVVASQNYLYHLSLLLGKTNSRIQANYIIWKTVESYLPFCSDDIRDIYSKYNNLPPREDHCFEEAVKRFYSTIETSYMTKYKEEETTSSLKLMAGLITNQDEDNQVSIMGPGGSHFGFTDLQISTMFKNAINMINEIHRKDYNEFFKCIGKKSSCTREGYYDSSAIYRKSGAHYDTDENTVYLPYSLVYSDFYRWDQPNFINYARIGRIIGDVYIEASQEENLSDVEKVGVDLAYQAYQKWIQDEGNEPVLPALNYTPNQLFWIHSTSLFCPLEDEEDMKKLKEVEDSDDFKKDFHCQ